MLRVVRVGGSLLDWPQLSLALSQWIVESDHGISSLLIAGGGALVEAIRDECRIVDIPDDVAHWRCIDAMSTTAAQLGDLLGLPVIADPTAVREPIAEVGSVRRPHESPASHVAPSVAFVCDVRFYLRHVEPREPGIPLPTDWSVSSDSIAARVAGCMDADELILLKSADPPAPPTAWQQLADAGYVDMFFPIAVQAMARAGRPVRFVNLRGIDPAMRA